MTSIIAVAACRKAVCTAGFEALSRASISDIEEGEIIALLGPNGRRQVPHLFSTICGITRSNAGSVSVGGHDIHSDYRAARAMIRPGAPRRSASTLRDDRQYGAFLARACSGNPPDGGRIDRLLAALSLFGEKERAHRELSGGIETPRS